MLYETIIPNRGSSILKKNYAFKYFPPNWHYHREYEILVITEGKGKRFVSRSVTPFCEGDVVLIGSNVPHFHLSDSIYYENNDLRSQSQVIQFVPEVLPEDVGENPAFSAIWSLLERSKQGVKFDNPEISGLIMNQFNHIEQTYGLDRLVELYRMLDQLGRETDYTILSVEGASHENSPVTDDLTVFKCYQYLLSHFKEEMSVEKIAAYVNRNPSALCRCFKNATGRTIFGCLTEIRIDHAYKLLTTTNFSVSQIAHECGFGTISNFNHRFLRMTGVPPLEYRAQSRMSK